jgi:hypothetical protein
MKKKVLVLALMTLLVIVMNIVCLKVSTERKKESRFGFALDALDNPEPLVEHPERKGEIAPEGIILAIDTTNPYKEWYNGDALNEWHVDESYNNTLAWRKLDIVLAVDEEEIDKWGSDYAIRAIERADEAFVANYHLDFRIRAVITYDSDDSIKWFLPDLFDDAFSKLSHLLGSDIDGYRIEAVFAISGQETIDSDVYGLAPHPAIMGNNTVTLIRFSSMWWADDNIPEHEAGHLLNCDDHAEQEDLFCVMAGYKDFIGILVEDGDPWDMFSNIRRSFRAYDWCSNCDTILHTMGNPVGGWHDSFMGLGVLVR